MLWAGRLVVVMAVPAGKKEWFKEWCTCWEKCEQMASRLCLGGMVWRTAGELASQRVGALPGRPTSYTVSVCPPAWLWVACSDQTGGESRHWWHQNLLSRVRWEAKRRGTGGGCVSRSTGGPCCLWAQLSPLVTGLCDLRGCVRVLLPGGVGAP